jgi:type III secretory pathway lipoprotein EscJ
VNTTTLSEIQERILNWGDSLKQKRMVILVLLLVLIGCNKSSSLLSEVDQKDLNNDVVTFLEKTKEANGIYLYSKIGESQYLILNNIYVNQGEQATFINYIQSEIQNKTLVIKIEELKTDKFDDKRIGKLKVFKINSENEFDTIHIFKNDKETNFDLVGG